MDILETLKERGFVKQCSNEQGLKKLLSSQKVVFYIGYDATADSLHIGHLIPIMIMAHLQKAGDIPIVLIGGGTTLIGDPSGKTEMRRIMSPEEIKKNSEKFLVQFKKFLSFEKGRGMLLNNADWLIKLNYIEFLRNIGKYFKVNEMIKHEGYKLRMERETGLSFIEFNYQLLQAYDFLHLFENYNCKLQIGGDDQWGNILAGVELIRQKTGKMAYGLTIPLLTTSGGKKMGKTEAGSVWLDAEKTSPYEFYQYWINTDDNDTIRFLKIFTFLPMEKIDELAKLKGAELRKAKEILAFEITKIVHGKKEAEKARASSKAVFSEGGEDLTSVPTVTIKIGEGIMILDLLTGTGVVPSKSEGSRLIRQGGVYINNKKINSTTAIIKKDSFKNGSLLLRKGKKQYKRVVIK